MKLNIKNALKLKKCPWKIPLFLKSFLKPSLIVTWDHVEEDCDHRSTPLPTPHQRRRTQLWSTSWHRMLDCCCSSLVSRTHSTLADDDCLGNIQHVDLLQLQCQDPLQTDHTNWTRYLSAETCCSMSVLYVLRNEVWKEAIILLVEAWYWGYFFPALISLCSAESWQSLMMSNIAGLGPVECGQGQLHPLTKELHQLTQVIIILTLLEFMTFHSINNQKEKNKYCTSMHGLDQENIFCFSCSWWWESNNELIDAEVSHMCWLHKHSTTDLCWYFQLSIVFRSKNTPDTSVVARLVNIKSGRPGGCDL